MNLDLIECDQFSYRFFVVNTSRCTSWMFEKLRILHGNLWCEYFISGVSGEVSLETEGVFNCWQQFDVAQNYACLAQGSNKPASLLSFTGKLKWRYGSRNLQIMQTVSFKDYSNWVGRDKFYECSRNSAYSGQNKHKLILLQQNAT